MKLFVRKTIVTLFLFITFQNLHAQKLAIVPYVSGINSPIDLKQCGDDRLFVADKGGFIRIINSDGSLRPTPFLDISSKISTASSEEGLFGIAFSPNYKTDGKFFVHYAANISGQLSVVIEQYKVNPADSNLADISSALTILTQSIPGQDDFGGNIMFGKDGFLYINIGDGQNGGSGQNKTTFLGKILRIDVSNSSISQPYAIPASNPFYNDATLNIKKEMWAYGVRNPFRCSFDRLTGDFLLVDVGEQNVEEVNFQNANSGGGQNYGWDIVEGESCFAPSTGCDKTGITMPIYEYFHNGGNAAIIGGYVYRSAQSKALWGQYIFTDFIKKWINAFYIANGAVSGNVNQLINPADAPGNPISFGEDRYGDQYIIFNSNGTIYKLEDTSYLRRPKAYFTPIAQGEGTSYLLQSWQGRNLTYQWLSNGVVIAGENLPDYLASETGNYRLVVTNDLGFSDTSGIFSFGALPLNLISFTAQKISKNNVRLQWETASEQNIKGYTILRKQNDQAVFTALGFVKSKSINGNSGNIIDYAYNDSTAVNNSKLFYRLQIENSNASYTYSDIRMIDQVEDKIIYDIYPNPAKGQVSVLIDGFKQPVTVRIFNSAGQKVKEQSLNQSNTIVDLSKLKGIYFVQLSGKDGSGLARKKLIVQ